MSSSKSASSSRQSFHEKRVRQQVINNLKNQQSAAPRSKLEARKRSQPYADNKGDNNDTNESYSKRHRGIGLDKLVSRGKNSNQHTIDHATNQFLMESRQKTQYQRLKDKQSAKNARIESGEIERDSKTSFAMHRMKIMEDAEIHRDDDELVQLRDAELAQTQKEQEQKDKATEKRQHRNLQLKIAKQFTFYVLARVRQSLYNIRHDNPAENEYDIMLKCPLDVFAIYEKLDPSPEQKEAMGYVSRKMRMFFDWDPKELGKGVRKSRLISEPKQPSLVMTRIKAPDIAAMVKLQKRVQDIERLMGKEQKFAELQSNIQQKKQLSRQLTKKTPKGQLLMKGHAEHLLNKIQSKQAENKM